MQQNWDPILPVESPGNGPGEGSALSRFANKWWPVMLSGSVGVVVITALVILVPDWGATEDTEVTDPTEEVGRKATIPDTPSEARVVEGSEATVGGGRDTKLVFEHVTVFVPDESVTDEGLLRVRISQSATPDGLGSVADAVDFVLEDTEQVAPFDLEVDLPDGLGDMTLHAVTDAAGSCCEAMPSEWDSERGVMTTMVQWPSTSHFVTAALSDLETLTTALTEARFIPESRPNPPVECAENDATGSQGWNLNPSGAEFLQWCLARTATGRTLRVRNQMNQTMALYLPEQMTAESSGEPFPLPGLLERISDALAADGRRVTVLKPGDLVEVYLGPVGIGEESALIARPDVFTWTSDIFEVTVDMLAAAYAGIPAWALPAEVEDLKSREAALSSLQVYPCIAELGAGGALMSADVQAVTGIAGAVASCVQDWLMDRGATGWVLPALSRVAENPGNVLSTLIEDGSVNNPGNGQLIGITRSSPPTTGGTTDRADSSGTRSGDSTSGGSRAATCPTVARGEWSGTWSSDSSGSGSFSARIDETGATLSGTIRITGSTYVPGGRLTGSTDCEQIEFGYVERSVEFDGTLDAGGRTMTGTYESLSGGRVMDRGTFTAQSSS